MRRRTLLAGATMLPLGLPVWAQETYPARPITMIVPFPPGGVADITGRPTAHVMGKLLKQSANDLADYKQSLDALRRLFG